MSKGYSIKWVGDKILDKVQDAVVKGIKKSLFDLQDQVNPQIPHDTGDLMGNYSVRIDGEIEKRPKEGDPITGDTQAGSIVGVAGYSLPYARRQHEELDYRHDEDRKAKFLEDPFNANRSKYKSFVKEEVKKALK